MCTGAMSQDFTLTAKDGAAIAATVFRPQGDGIPVVIQSATAVPRGYYAKFARHLAEHGFLVVTFDYRGIGGSRGPGSLRHLEGGTSAWAQLDAGAAHAWIREATGRPRALVVGHSIGGQIVGLLPEPQHVAGVLGVAAQSGYWRLWTGARRLQMFVYMHALLPLVANALGHVPGWMGIGEDLPRSAALEWARWCRTPGYLLGDDPRRHEPYARVVGPVLGYSFADDSYAPHANVATWLRFFPSASIEHRHVEPAQLGVKAIGHFGFFRQSFESTLWADARAWLLEHAHRTARP